MAGRKRLRKGKRVSGLFRGKRRKPVGVQPFSVPCINLGIFQAHLRNTQ